MSKAIFSDTRESRPISRRHSRQLSDTHRILASKEPREQTVGMLIAFPKAQRFYEIIRRRKKMLHGLMGSLLENRRYESAVVVSPRVERARGKREREPEFDCVKNIELSRPEAHNPPREKAR